MAVGTISILKHQRRFEEAPNIYQTLVANIRNRIKFNHKCHAIGEANLAVADQLQALQLPDQIA